MWIYHNFNVNILFNRFTSNKIYNIVVTEFVLYINSKVFLIISLHGHGSGDTPTLQRAVVSLHFTNFSQVHYTSSVDTVLVFTLQVL